MVEKSIDQHGGLIIGNLLKKYGVKHLFTLCGGHISPLLIGCKTHNISIIDVRHEVTAVYAADAMFRLTGIPGIAAVTAGPGLTNTITALKNSQMAESAVILFGGATASILKGRGSLQDIDQITLIKSHVKWYKSIRRVRDIVPIVVKALEVSLSGTPGPVFLELPIDLLYPEEIVKKWMFAEKPPKTLLGKLFNWYLHKYTYNLFSKGSEITPKPTLQISQWHPKDRQINKLVRLINQSVRPVLVIGSQALLNFKHTTLLARIVQESGIPVYVSGMARGLFGIDNPNQYRHKRGLALRATDLVILAGVPMDFRLDYGRVINRKADLVIINRKRKELSRNWTLKRAKLKIHADPTETLVKCFNHELINHHNNHNKWRKWHFILKEREDKRNQEIEGFKIIQSDGINPIYACSILDEVIDEDCFIVADGGDFISSFSYVFKPRKARRWLDPGVFGTLGPGAGFALAAKLVNSDTETWIIYGDGSAGYSIIEFDTYVRHKIPVIAVIGNDASWQQIAREQVEVFQDSLATDLLYTDYHIVAEGLGAKGILIDKPEDIHSKLLEAKSIASQGIPVLVNIILGNTDFRKGSISM